MKKGNAIALLPIGVFLCIYLGLGILFEYVMKIPMGFYNVPIIIAFLAAILVACLQNRKVSFDEKLEIMAQGLADKNIITMLLIFLTAGAFVGVVGRSSAESVAYFMLSLIPARFSVAVLFVVACFVSVAMGTSVGTITLITPIAVSVSKASGFDMALCIGSVMGGSMFGDNLSFISDTTIAACNGQGCQMKDKFRENFGIALPAAIATLVLILVLSFQTDIAGRVSKSYNLVQIIPYVLVLIGGIIGINVFVVLLSGIVSGSIIMLAGGHIAATDLLANMGSGASGMFETSMVAILVAAMCALIREYGGFDALLAGIHKVFKGRKGGQFGMGLLVGTMDIATANNTVAIVMANPIAKDMAEEYGITPRKAASILDTFSCVFQGIIPYGAQMLVAISAASELGYNVSAFQIMPKLFYPFLLFVSSMIFIFVIPAKKERYIVKEEIRQKLTGAVIGLARTCENNEKTENTNRVFLEALTVAGDWSASIFDMSEMLEKVRNEKYTVSPGCVTCAAPCGNTDDYDMENLWKESEEIGAFKNTILMVICQTAAKLYHADQTEESETVKLLFRALCMISFEGWDVAGLTPVMVELGKAGRI